MSERLTIVWETPRGILSRAERDAGRAVIADLQIDRAFRLICPDAMYREAFLSVLCTPLTDADEIRARSAILEAFRETPQLLAKLIELVRRLLVAKNSWDAERARLVASRRVDPHDKSMLLWTARGTLVLTAHFVRVYIACLRELHETLQMFGCVNGWLGRLKERVRLIACTRETEDLLSFTDHIEKHLSNAHSYEVECALDDRLRLSPLFLRDFAFLHTPDKVQKKAKKPLFSFFDKNDKNDKTDKQATASVPEAPKEVSVGSVEVDWSLESAAHAVQECDRYLTSFLRTVTDIFSGLEEELYFYKAALLHIERLVERNVTLVYPDWLPSDANVLRIDQLSDLLLLTESMNVQSVVPNDVRFERTDGIGGMLITGKNNSGKTVYLRSVGTAVLLAQCGLPIPAKAATLSIRNRIFTTFAKAEGALEPLSSAGRFEEEVAELAAILDRVEPDSLLLLNETFQTTAYDEGADGMAAILSYLSALGCGFLFVTHLTKLKTIYAERPGVTILKTSDDPRTRYKIGTEEGRQ